MRITQNELSQLSETMGLEKKKIYQILSACKVFGDLIDMNKEELKTNQGKLRFHLFQQICNLKGKE